MSGSNSFAKTICSICYEDLKPIVEDLQAISICGHVFHELCLQQWFEYCTNTKKQTCPVCKQGCTKKSVTRLYFQSIGDSILSQSQNECFKRNNNNHDAENAELLRIEVKRLEAKVSVLSSAVDFHQEDLKQVKEELQICKENLSKEVALKTEALRHKECIQSLLQTKSSDLIKSNLECSKLQERNLALVKELAALKLVSDCNLEEEEIVKLATVGNENNNQDAIDVLKKSLVIRNKTYKELMAKCNTLGRGEARSLRKLEKAQEKILKLKTRVQELETTIEAKDNEHLRSLKAPNSNPDNVALPTMNKSVGPSTGLNQSPFEQKGQSPTSVIDLDEEEGDDLYVNKEANKSCDDAEQQKSKTVDTHPQNCKDRFYQKCKSIGTVDSDNKEDQIQQSKSNHPQGLPDFAGLRNEVFKDPATKEALGLGLQDIRQVQPSFQPNAETSFIHLAEPGNRCFTGGLLGPDGANRYLGKWCKRGQNKGPSGLSNNADSLISVGADGRGGTIKVLRSLNQTTMDVDDSVVSAKRFRSGSHSSGLRSHGCRQIDHFFKKTNN
ncbi:unnamed protein product [Amaranthus hypochondriacus]